MFSSIAVDMVRDREKVLIASVADFFFEKLKKSGQPIDFKNVSSRTAKTCKISVSPVLRCRQWAAIQRPTLKKARTKAFRSKVNIDEFTAIAVRLVVQSFLCVGDHPTLNKGLAKCREEIADFHDISRTSFGSSHQ